MRKDTVMQFFVTYAEVGKICRISRQAVFLWGDNIPRKYANILAKEAGRRAKLLLSEYRGLGNE
jgi:hypothetical protein